MQILQSHWAAIKLNSWNLFTVTVTEDKIAKKAVFLLRPQKQLQKMLAYLVKRIYN